MNKKTPLQVNDLVIGKIKGYPWWPGKVSISFTICNLIQIDSVKEEFRDEEMIYEYNISFIGDNTQ